VPAACDLSILILGRRTPNTRPQASSKALCVAGPPFNLSPTHGIPYYVLKWRLELARSTMSLGLRRSIFSEGQHHDFGFIFLVTVTEHEGLIVISRIESVYSNQQHLIASSQSSHSSAGQDNP